MSEEKNFTESEAQLYFAKGFNGKTWELLDKGERTHEENELLVDYAHASLAHWRVVGTGVNLQRGVWMLARVYTVLGNTVLALQHAKHCLELTEQHKNLLADFDFAFAYECMARAQALAGNRAEALKYWDMADKAGEIIKDKEDRQIFFDDFNGGDWYGFK
jgi:tetratricopeptide (TPR) repeat protein